MMNRRTLLTGIGATLAVGVSAPAIAKGFVRSPEQEELIQHFYRHFDETYPVEEFPYEANLLKTTKQAIAILVDRNSLNKDNTLRYPCNLFFNDIKQEKTARASCSQTYSKPYSIVDFHQRNISPMELANEWEENKSNLQILFNWHENTWFTYVPLNPVRCVNLETYQPMIRFKTRGVLAPFGERIYTWRTNLYK
jgi:hypothetical protein